jgi:regulator of protease activity HflC (stomatin/prohibitin superfamily)
LGYLVVSEGLAMNWGVGLVGLLVAVAAATGWRRVPAGCVATLQRRGRYRQALDPGWHWLVPGVERLGPAVPLIGHQLDVRTTAAQAALHFQILEPGRAGAALDSVDDWVGAQAREALRNQPDAAPEALKHELNRRIAPHGLRVVRCTR